MLCRLSDFRPHSSPDPFGATLPPGEGIFTAPLGRRAILESPLREGRAGMMMGLPFFGPEWYNQFTITNYK